MQDAAAVRVRAGHHDRTEVVEDRLTRRDVAAGIGRRDPALGVVVGAMTARDLQVGVGARYRVQEIAIADAAVSHRVSAILRDEESDVVAVLVGTRGDAGANRDGYLLAADAGGALKDDCLLRAAFGR